MTVADVVVVVVDDGEGGESFGRVVGPVITKPPSTTTTSLGHAKSLSMLAMHPLYLTGMDTGASCSLL